MTPTPTVCPSVDWSDFRTSTPEERASTLGPSFARIDVQRARIDSDEQATILCTIGGRAVKLMGQPERALRSYLVSRDEEEAMQ